MAKHLKFEVPEESPALDVQGGPAFGPKPLPTISFPASEEQVNSVGVGDTIKVTFEGEVMSATGGKSLVDAAQSFEPTEIQMQISNSDISVTGDKQEPASVMEQLFGGVDGKA